MKKKRLKVERLQSNKNKEKLSFLQKMLTYGFGKLQKLVSLRAMFHVNQ